MPLYVSYVLSVPVPSWSVFTGLRTAAEEDCEEEAELADASGSDTDDVCDEESTLDEDVLEFFSGDNIEARYFRLYEMISPPPCGTLSFAESIAAEPVRSVLAE